MAVSLDIVEGKIDLETKQCVERHKQTDFFTRLFNSRQSYKPKCRANAIAKYQDEYNAAQNALLDNEALIDNKFKKELTKDDVQSVTQYVILAVIVGAAIALIIKL